MAKKIYVDDQLVGISAVEWTKRRSSPDHKYIVRYESDKIKMDLEWTGICDGNIPKEYWTPFKLVFCNRIITGDRPGTFVKKDIEDPSLSEMYRTKELGLMAFYSSLIDMKMIEVEEDYEGDATFEEIGNKYASKIVELNFEGKVIGLIDKRKPLALAKEAVKASALFGSW